MTNTKLYTFENEELAKLLKQREIIVNEGRKNSQEANKILKEGLIEYLNGENFDFDITSKDSEVIIKLRSGSVDTLLEKIKENDSINVKLMQKIKQFDERGSEIVYDEMKDKVDEFGQIGAYRLVEGNIIEAEERDAIEEFKEYFLEAKKQQKID